LPFCTFFLAIVLSVLLRYKDSDYPFANWYLQTLLIIHYTISITHNQSLPNNVILILVISHGRGRDREVLTTSGTYPCSYVAQIFYSGPKHAHKSTDDHYKILNTTAIPPTVISNYWTRTQFHRQSL
jgi:hypothetical protein